MQVPGITEIQSNGLNQSHQDEDSDKDELVVLWQGRILVEMTITTMQLNELKCYFLPGLNLKIQKNAGKNKYPETVVHNNL